LGYALRLTRTCPSFGVDSFDVDAGFFGAACFFAGRSRSTAGS
jgi:hypothetical protein